MAGAGEMITGRGAKKQARLAEQAQARQAAELAEEKRKVKEVEDGQIANARTGGVGGLLAYVDRGRASGAPLAEQMGGSATTSLGELARNMLRGGR